VISEFDDILLTVILSLDLISYFCSLSSKNY